MEKVSCIYAPCTDGLSGAEMPLQTLLVSNAKDLWLIALQAKVLSSARLGPVQCAASARLSA